MPPSGTDSEGLGTSAAPKRNVEVLVTGFGVSFRRECELLTFSNTRWI